jgi:outer membrane lipoprotein SlyB
MNRAKKLTSLALMVALTSAPIFAKSGSGRWAGRGAAGGAILGLLVGGDLGGAVVGAAVGAAGGAAGGAISDSNKKKKANKAELEELREKEAEREAYDLPQTEEEWIAAIGQDNTNALDALVDCQHDRAELLAKAGATSENPDFALAGYWLEALVAVDSKDQATAESLFAELVDLDDDVDTVQQASVAADQAILKIRETRSAEEISCER